MTVERRNWTNLPAVVVDTPTPRGGPMFSDWSTPTPNLPAVSGRSAARQGAVRRTDWTATAPTPSLPAVTPRNPRPRSSPEPQQRNPVSRADWSANPTRTAAQQEVDDAIYQSQSHAVLRRTMGENYEDRTTAIATLFENTGDPEALEDTLLLARDAAGHRLGDNPLIVAWLTELGERLGSGGALTFADLTQGTRQFLPGLRDAEAFAATLADLPGTAFLALVAEARTPAPDVLALNASQLAYARTRDRAGIVDALGHRAAKGLAVIQARALRMLSQLAPADQAALVRWEASLPVDAAWALAQQFAQ